MCWCAQNLLCLHCKSRSVSSLGAQQKSHAQFAENTFLQDNFDSVFQFSFDQLVSAVQSPQCPSSLHCSVARYQILRFLTFHVSCLRFFIKTCLLSLSRPVRGIIPIISYSLFFAVTMSQCHSHRLRIFQNCNNFSMFLEDSPHRVRLRVTPFLNDI